MERFVAWAQQVGVQTTHQVEAMFERKDHKEQAFRTDAACNRWSVSMAVLAWKLLVVVPIPLALSVCAVSVRCCKPKWTKTHYPVSLP